jgi:translation elongation factor EF-1beta
LGVFVTGSEVTEPLVMLDVKPVDDTTDLDALAPKIFKEITQDCLFWKTEYKKVPVAFGVFKLYLGRGSGLLAQNRPQF